MRKNKKAWLRILEAFIAIMLIASVLVILYLRAVEKPKAEEEVYKLQKIILDEIADDPSLRSAALNMNNAILYEFARDRIPIGFKLDIRICEIEYICRLPFYREYVYSSERIIASTLAEYKPKKIKIFMWQE